MQVQAVRLFVFLMHSEKELYVPVWTLTLILWILSDSKSGYYGAFWFNWEISLSCFVIRYDALLKCLFLLDYQSQALEHDGVLLVNGEWPSQRANSTELWGFLCWINRIGYFSNRRVACDFLDAIDVTWSYCNA